MPPSTATQVVSSSSLDGADAVERHAGAPDERAAGLEPDLGLGQPVRRKRDPRRLRRRRGELGGVGHVLLGVVADAEPAAEVGDARRPAELRRGTRAAKAASRRIVSAWASKSASCEPTCTWSPSTSSPRVERVARCSVSAWSGGSPNFEP